MVSFRRSIRIRDYETYFHAILLLKWSFSCIFLSVTLNIFYIHYKMGRFRFGGRLRGSKPLNSLLLK